MYFLFSFYKDRHSCSLLILAVDTSHTSDTSHVEWHAGAKNLFFASLPRGREARRHLDVKSDATFEDMRSPFLNFRSPRADGKAWQKVADKVERMVPLAFTQPIRQSRRPRADSSSPSTQLNQIPSRNTNRPSGCMIFSPLVVAPSGPPSHASRLADKFRGFGHS